MIKKIAVAAASAMLVATVFAAGARPAYAAAKVDCDAVMNELNSGKKQKEVATDLSTTVYQVRKCKRLAAAAAKPSTKTSLQAKTGKDVTAAPAMAPAAASSPAAAASPAAKP